MANYFKRNERKLFVTCLVATVAAGAASVLAIGFSHALAGRLTATFGLLATLTGVVQLEVSGLFTKLMEIYGDDTKYPYGPPSYITREIIDDPDAPVLSWTRTYAFFTPATGFWLIVLGTLIQVLAVWL